MSLRKTLNALLREILQQADADPAFRGRLEAALGSDQPSKPKRAAGDGPRNVSAKRGANRRARAVLDPVHLARQGEDALRAELAKLTLEQLRDVVAEYGMDPGKLVAKWRDAERVLERIVEVSRGRAQKGSAFREQPGPAAPETPDESHDG